MIPVSGRFAPLLVVLLLLALVPIARHSYLGAYVDACADPEALFEVERIPRVIRARELEKEHVGLRFQFTTGTLEDPRPNRSPRFFLLRTYDPSELYMQPTYHLRSEFEADRHELEWLTVDGDRIPVWWQSGHSNRRNRVVGLVYVFGSRPVAHPLRAQIASLPGQLLRGSRPLTLFLVSGLVPPGRPELLQESARDWFAAAWRFYRAVCID